MLISKLAGKRHLPIFVGTYKRQLQSYNGKSPFIYEGTPVVQFIDIIGGSLTNPKLKNLETGVETVLSVLEDTFTHLGTDYKVFEFQSTTADNGQYSIIFNYTPNGGSLTSYHTAIFTINEPNCSEWRLEYTPKCDDPQLGEETYTNVLYFNDMSVKSAGVQEYQEGEEDGTGRVIIDFIRQRGSYSATFSANSLLLDRLQYLKSYGFVKIINTISGEELLIDPSSIEVALTESPIDDIIGKLNFAIIGDEVCISDCGSTIYANNPYPDEGSVDNGGGVDCTGHAVTIDNTLFPTLSAVVVEPTGGGTSIVNWYKNGVFQSKGASILTNGFGTYTAKAVHVDCGTVEASFVYSDVCGELAIEASVVGSVISANFTGVPDGETVTVQILDSGGTVRGTSLPFDATGFGTGTYTIKYSTASCPSKNHIVYVNLNEACSYSFYIVRSGDQLIPIVTGLLGGETITYLWQYENVLGIKELFAVTETIVPTYFGIYHLNMTVDGCDKSNYLLYGNATTVPSRQYQEFRSQIATRFFISKFTLPSKALNTADEINRIMDVILSQNTLTYVAGSPTSFSEFTIDNVTNEIVLFGNTNQQDILKVYLYAG